MQAVETTPGIDVLMKLIMPDNKTKDVAKRIPFESMTFNGLVEKALTLAAKHDMLDGDQTPMITYEDKKSKSTIEVEDDTDLELAIA